MKVDCGYTENFFKELDRMCKSSVSCDRCEIKPIMDKYHRIGCREVIIDHPIDILNVIQKWSDEHQVETRAEHFLKMYPNARMHNEGYPSACVKNLDNNVSCEVCLIGCKKCWDKPYIEGEF